MKKELVIFVDGASRGNPGHSGYGVLIEDAGGALVLEAYDYIGETTNSVAEYRALLRGLEEAKKLGGETLTIYTDSQLVARQFEGTYRVKNEGLLPLFTRVRELERGFKSVQVKHILRSSMPGNKRADQLANIAINRLGPVSSK